MSRTTLFQHAAYQLAVQDDLYEDVEFLYDDENGYHIFKTIFKQDFFRSPENDLLPRMICVDDEGNAEWYTSDYIYHYDRNPDKPQLGTLSLNDRLEITRDTLEELGIPLHKKLKEILFDRNIIKKTPRLPVPHYSHLKVEGDGFEINHKLAVSNFEEAILKIGIDNILPLDIKWRSLPLLTKEPWIDYRKRYHEIGDHWFLYSTMTTGHKKDVLDKIIKLLHLNWTVTIW